MPRTKKLSIECVNQVKLEKVEEFQDSIFSDVYLNAFMQVERMISMTDARESDREIENFCVGNTISNVISFVGERGMGKSSAMLSFAYFLKKYPYNMEGDKENKGESFRFKRNEKELNDLYFYTLPRVDATILTHESLFDVVLARMWTEFSEKTERLGEDKYGLNSTKERFNSIKNVYTLYYKDEKQNKNLTSVKQLQELSKSMALREEFAGLVSSFLECMVAGGRIAQRDRYLVIPIDDLDIASGKTLDILEQLRIFLSVPQVIVLTTVDIERLLLCGNKNFAEELICGDIAEAEEKNLIRQYSNQYIAKVLPRNSRISMPRYGRNAAVKYVLDYEKYVSRLMENIVESDKKNDVEYISFINMVTAKHLNLIMKHKDSLILPGESLRNIVNKTNELWTIHCHYSDNAKDFVFEWLEKEISLSLKQFYGLKSFCKIRNFSSISIDDYNEYITQNFAGKNNAAMGRSVRPARLANSARSARPGYGRVLRCLADARNENYEERDLLKELVLYYSLQIAKCVDEGDVKALRDSFVRGDIFSSVVSQKVIFRFEETRRINPLLKLELKYGEDAGTAADIMRENAQQIVDVFKVFLFCSMKRVMDGIDMEIMRDPGERKKIPGTGVQKETEMEETEQEGTQPEETEQQETESEETVLELGVEAAVSFISIDNFFRNALNYEELFRKYIRWIYEPLKKYIQQKGKDDNTEFETAYASVLEESRNGVKEMQEWKERYHIKELYDILPIQNVEVMLGIIDRIRKPGFIWDSIDRMMQEFEKAFSQEFEEAENECLYEELGYQRYSRKLKDLLNCIDLKGVSSGRKDRLAVMAQRYEDTTKLE